MASTAQIKTLNTLIARGGEMNSYAGQPGFNGNSIPALIRLGLVERVSDCTDGGCPGWEDDTECARPLINQPAGHRCLNRVRITDAGRAATR